MRVRYVKLLLLSLILCFGAAGCSTKAPETSVEQTEDAETEENSVKVMVEEPSEEGGDSEAIPEVDVELE